MRDTLIVSLPETASPPGTRTRRADALDALRGFAILTMALSSLIPFGVLPTWMYHAQQPPPAHAFDPNLPGLTWVDLVFPFFLFSMGASMPLALSRRIGNGKPQWGQLLPYVAKRGFLLAFFAIFVQHVRPGTMNPHPTTATWLTALLGFAVLFPILARLPGTWGRTAQWAVRGIGWGAAVAMLAIVTFPPESKLGTGFSLARSDIIIVVLANMAVFGSVAWLVTRRNLLVRLSFLGILLAIRLSHEWAGWVQAAWNWSPAPWIYKLYYLQYLFIVIPGTIAGDEILSWLRMPRGGTDDRHAWSGARLLAIAALMLSFVVLLLAGLHARWLPWTALIAFAMCAIGWHFCARPVNADEALVQRLFVWGTYWLVLGLVFEPYEGGIKKDHPTLSYYFVTTGLAVFALIACTIVIDMLGHRRWSRLLIDNGQNPMVAYAGINNLLAPVLALTGLGGLIATLTPTPWLGFLGGCIKTFLLALAVSAVTRLRVFWRT